jgi:DNA-binding response OmpR family regulator
VQEPKPEATRRPVNEAENPRPEKARLEAAAPAARVMIADDNLDHVATTTLLLKTEGYEVRGVSSGAQLLEQFTAFRPDVVILDIGMPGLTGYDVARALRGDRKGAEVLLIALTGYDTQTDRFLSRLAGFDYHLVKPADPGAVSALIRGYLAGNRPVRVHVIPEHGDPR